MFEDIINKLQEIFIFFIYFLFVSIIIGGIILHYHEILEELVKDFKRKD